MPRGKCKPTTDGEAFEFIETMNTLLNVSTGGSEFLRVGGTLYPEFSHDTQRRAGGFQVQSLNPLLP